MEIVLLNKIISSIIQIILFAIIPFFWWIITARNKENFFAWVGLKKINKENKKKSVTTALMVTASYIILSIFILYLVKDIKTATSEFNGMGLSALLPIINLKVSL